jgi:hypothetical protein
MVGRLTPVGPSMTARHQLLLPIGGGVPRIYQVGALAMLSLKFYNPLLNRFAHRILLPLLGLGAYVPAFCIPVVSGKRLLNSTRAAPPLGLACCVEFEEFLT